MAANVQEFLGELTEDRRIAISAVRDTILKNLPEGYEEGIQYGMIAYFVPHSVYPKGYHCNPKEPVPFVLIASQKASMSLHLFCLYVDGARKNWFEEAYRASGKKLNMGKACLRFKKLDDLPLDVIGELIAQIPVAEHLKNCAAGLRK